MQKIYVIYHRVDFDGRGSAAAIYDYYMQQPNANEKYDIEFFPYQHEDPLPNFEEWDETGLVYLSDMAFKRAPMEFLLNKFGDRLFWNDHHISAVEETKGLKFNGIQRMDYSGVHLTWLWLHKEELGLTADEINGEIFPHSINMIGCKDVHLQIGSNPTDYNNREAFDASLDMHTELYNPTHNDWSELLKDNETLIEKMLEEGELIKKYKDSQSEKAAESMINFVEFEGYKNIPTVNTNFVRQDVFERVQTESGKTLYEESPFVLVYYRLSNGYWKFSMRTIHNDIDLSKLAGKYGGGGHRKASAFRTKTLPFD